MTNKTNFDKRKKGRQKDIRTSLDNDKTYNRKKKRRYTERKKERGYHLEEKRRERDRDRERDREREVNMMYSFP